MAPPVSKLWNYFNKKDGKTATCKQCLRDVKYSGNTTNLSSHLKKNHPKIYSDISGLTKQSKINTPLKVEIFDQPGTSTAAVNLPATSTASVFTDTPENRSQEKLSLISPIAEAFSKSRLYAEGGLRYSKIVDCLLYLICKDKRPFYMLEGEGFRRLMKELAPSFKVPSPKYIKKQLDLKYQSVSNNMKQRIADAPHVSFSMDTWTETMAEKSFFGITCHFLEGSNIISVDLSLVQLSSNHTAELLEQTMLQVFKEWNIDTKKIVSITTDNGSNMVAAVKSSFEPQHVPCFAHTLNLVTETAVSHEKIEPIIKKVRGVVKYIKNSVIMSDKLRKAQMDNNVPEGKMRKMILDVKTRWNSTYYMVERFLDLLKIVSQLLIEEPSSPEMPNAVEIDALRNLAAILRPFEFATSEISGEKYVTMSKIIPMVNTLTTHLLNFKSNDPAIETVRKVLLAAMQKRFGNAELNSKIAISTILDPRFKNIHFKNPTGCAKAIAKLKKLCVEEGSSESEEEALEKTDPEPFDFWKTHKELVYGKRRKKKHEDSGDSSEVTLYLANPLSHLKTNPLEDWEDMKAVFPGLYKQARQYLLNMATSVPCERLFSKAGGIMTQDRNRLSGKYLNKLTFLGSVSEEEWFK